MTFLLVPKHRYPTNPKSEDYNVSVYIDTVGHYRRLLGQKRLSRPLGINVDSASRTKSHV